MTEPSIFILTMPIALYPFQFATKLRVYSAWASGAQNVLMVMPTGSGKTVVFTDIVRENGAPSIVIAHRHELVSQASVALARAGVRHRVIGSASTVHACVQANVIEFNRNYVDPTNSTVVASVDTLIRRSPESWMQYVTLLVQDEAHHMLRDNKWGRVLALFPPTVRVLGVTAETQRADGHGLGRHASGVMDALVEGPTTFELIQMGRLSKYRVFAPPSSLDLSNVKLSASGDYSPIPMADAVHKARIVGDVVDHYLRVCPGERGLTFAVDLTAARELTSAYMARGVPAEMVSADTPAALRRHIVRRLATGDLKQIVNVDIFGEGFDSPAVVSVSMVRPTQSRQMFKQQAGRMFRVSDGKSHGILFDHVGNVARHGLPDRAYRQTLDGRERRSGHGQDVIIPIRVCPQCTAAFERIYRVCPECGYEIVPGDRSSIESVDGDLYELDPAVLARMRGAIDSSPAFPYDAAPIVIASIKKNHREKAQAQAELRESMALWGGARTAEGESIRQAQRRFYHTYGVDVLSAQALNARDALSLKEKLE